MSDSWSIGATAESSSFSPTPTTAPTTQAIKIRRYSGVAFHQANQPRGGGEALATVGTSAMELLGGKGRRSRSSSVKKGCQSGNEWQRKTMSQPQLEASP